MSQQSHGQTLWQEAAGSGGAPIPVAEYLLKSGADVIPSLTGPDQCAFYQLESNGDYVLIDLTIAVYLVSDGAGGYEPSGVGPATAILVDDGAGGVQLSTTLTLTPIADLLYDTGGTLWLVLRSTNRLRALSVRGDIRLY